MDYEMIEELVEIFCEEQLVNAKLDSDKKNNYKTMAYGVVQFACNNLFSCFNKELADWWSGFKSCFDN